jgi:hypothetical protein
MAWILVGALLVSGTFFLMVLRQVLRTEERLRGIVVRNEARLSQRYKARLLVPKDGETGEES